MATILIAPDKFKGSLTASQVCEIFKRVLSRHGPQHQIIAVPMADGGEGSYEALTIFSGGKKITTSVHGPLQNPVTASYGISRDGATAFMEMAQASGLQLLQSHERNPLLTNTYGTGELILHAIQSGVKKIIMGIGGSATSDGGIGLAAALDVVFKDASGNVLDPIGKNLSHIYAIDDSRLDHRVGEIDFTIFCDVANPLYGPQGAAQIYARQKGANDAAIEILDEGLHRLDRILSEKYQRTINFPGAGAGGGIAAMLSVITKLKVTKGIDFMIKITKLESLMKTADLVITGEGKIDQQTLSGKVVKGVADLALQHRKPVIAFAGKNDLSARQLKGIGVSKIFTLQHDGIGEQFAIDNAGTLLEALIIENCAEFG